MRAKINLAQQNQAATLPNEAVRAHPTRKTPNVKSNETRILSFNGAVPSGRFGKSADPTCYNVLVAGNSPCGRLFDIARI